MAATGSCFNVVNWPSVSMVSLLLYILENSTAKVYLYKQGGRYLLVSRLASYIFEFSQRHGIIPIKLKYTQTQFGK